MPGPIDDGSKGAPTGVAAIKDLVNDANAEDDKLKNNGGDAGDGDDDAAGSGDNADDSDEEEIPEEEGDDAGDADDQGDDSDDSSDDDSDDSKDDKGKATRRFTQFAGDGKTETYISNLEKGYQNSSAEAIRLKTEKDQADARVNSIMKVVASDPDMAAKLAEATKGSGDDSDSDSDGTTGADNPFVSDLKARWSEKSDQEIEDFIEANPEVVSDPKIAEDVKHYMSVLSNDHLARTGKLMTGGEAMAAAYRILGLDNKLTKQNLAHGAKKTAAPTRPQGGKKKSQTSSKQTFTSAQIAMAQRMGKDQAWLEKNAT